jgi:CBS domain-containing protein
MKTATSIDSYMSPSPCAIECQRSAAEALTLLQKHQVPYLPVLDGRKLAGIVSAHTIESLAATTGVPPERLRVGDVMTRDVCVVERGAAVGDVARAMAEYAYDLAVVIDGTEVAGIFTATDALRAVAALSRR